MMVINSQILEEMVRRYLFIIPTFLLHLFITSAGAQNCTTAKNDSLALERNIRFGRLDNGLSYFMKSLPEPQSKLYLRLYNRAGANQEDDDQYEFAHAVEHLSFKATQNFPQGIRGSELMKKGNMGMFDFTATSGRRQTQYIFDSPKNDPAALDMGFLWFRDIIDGLILSEEDIKSVEGELHQELMLRNGDNLSEFFTQSQLRALLYPCEKVPSNNKFKPENIRNFYKDWYRPELMGLIVVGNIIDIAKMEKRIIKNFSAIPPLENPKKLLDCDASYYARQPQFFIVERLPDTTRVLQNKNIELKLLFPDEKTQKKLHTTEGIKRLTMIQILMDITKDRFREISNESQSFQISPSYPYFLRGLPPAMEILLTVKNDTVKKPLEKGIQVLRQLEQFGVSNEEWKKTKNASLNFLNGENTAEAKYWINQIGRHYNYQEALPSNKKDKIQRWLTKLSKEEFNEFVNEFLSNKPRDIGIIAPAGHKVLSYTERQVRSTLEDVYSQPLSPFEVPEIPSKLISNEKKENLLESGYDIQGCGPAGAKEMVLSNGLRVILKTNPPSSKKEGKIGLQGFSLRGANCYPKEDYFSVINAPAIVKSAGINGMNSFQLKKFLAKTSLGAGGISLYVSDFETGLHSSAVDSDFEILLQLIYLFFTQPKEDEVAFEDWKIQEFEAFQYPAYNLTNMDFNSSIKTYLGESGEISIRGMKSQKGTIRFEGLEKIDYDIAFQAYKNLFGNPEDFTFIISGEFEIQSILPLLDKYLGNLPNSSNSLSCSSSKKDKQILPPGPLMIEIPAPKYYQMKNLSYGVRYIQRADSSYDWKEQVRVKALGVLTSDKAWELRFKDGFSLYMIGVAGRYNEDFNRYEISSTFDCVPEEFPLIRKAFKQIISDIKSGVISDEEFKKGMQRIYSLYDSKKINSPNVIDQKLYNYYRYGQPWVEPKAIENFVKSLTIEDLVKTANKYYKDENLFEFVMSEDL